MSVTAINYPSCGSGVPVRADLPLVVTTANSVSERASTHARTGLHPPPEAPRVPIQSLSLITPAKLDSNSTHDGGPSRRGGIIKFIVPTQFLRASLRFPSRS